ncbi:MAG TPA: tail fiber protein [Allosphingosinicella sp.]|nr:tail fiber protein [Allosphingosinicella sp.]
MGTPYMSEIKICAFGFAPKGWAQCNGQQLPINQNQALFSLLGTTYGGNGQTTFALPNLRGRASMHVGPGQQQGVSAGSETVTLTQAQMPAHVHFPQAKNAQGTGGAPSTSVVLAQAVAVQSDQSTVPVSMYSINAPTDLVLNAAAISNTGGSQPHENRQPYLTLNLCIALLGVFPSRN